ncbi:MAG: hypothetical protein AB7L92_08115 [Alphaproteobacteria bacterium]
MVRITLVVAALLLASQPEGAIAADKPDKRSENARKVTILLGALGVNSNDAKSLVQNIDSRIEDNTLNIAKDRVGPGTLKLHYRLGEGVSLKNVELQYAPDNSNWKAVARPDSVMVQYKYNF